MQLHMLTTCHPQLKILRQLIELQLSHSAEIRAKIDLAWGVNANKSKKKDPATVPPEPEDPNSKQNLQMLPIGQDFLRKRYWVVDSAYAFLHSADAYLRVFAGLFTKISLFMHLCEQFFRVTYTLTFHQSPLVSMFLPTLGRQPQRSKVSLPLVRSIWLPLKS